MREKNAIYRVLKGLSCTSQYRTWVSDKGVDKMPYSDLKKINK